MWSGCGDSRVGVPGSAASTDAASSSSAGEGGGGGASPTSAGSGGASSGTGGQGGDEPAPPAFDDIPWENGNDVGYGVARKDTQNPNGTAAFLAYGGYGATLDASCAWARELYLSDLAARGVRYVYCIQGPATPSYAGLEIGNSKIAKHLVANLPVDAAFVAIAAHSSGSFVAHELLGQLAGDLDPTDVTAGRVVYFNLDGGQSGLSAASVARLRRAYFVAARDSSTGTKSPNHGTMVALGATYASAGGLLELDGADSGCAPGASWCLHMVPILAKPHDPQGGDVATDYTDFAGRPVTTSYLTTTELDAGLLP